MRLTSWKRANTSEEEVNKWPDSELTPMSTQLGGATKIETKVGSEQSAALCKYLPGVLCLVNMEATQKSEPQNTRQWRRIGANLI